MILNIILNISRICTFKDLFLMMFMCVAVWQYVHVSEGIFRKQKKAWDHLELESQEV